MRGLGPDELMPGDRGFCGQPTEGFVGHIVETIIDERVLSPGVGSSGFEVSDDSAKQGGEVDAMPAVTDAVIDVIAATGCADRRGSIERPVNYSVPGALKSDCGKRGVEARELLAQLSFV